VGYQNNTSLPLCQNLTVHIFWFISVTSYMIKRLCHAMAKQQQATEVQSWLKTRLLHFRNTRSDNILSPILALCGLMKKPLWLNTRSTGADVAGAQKIFSNRLCRTVNCSSCCTAFHGSAERQCSADVRSPSSSSLFLAEALGWQPLQVSKQVPSDYSDGHGHTSKWLFNVFDSRPKTRTVRLLCEAKDYSFKAKGTSWPWGSLRPRWWRLEDSISGSDCFFV